MQHPPSTPQAQLVRGATESVPRVAPPTPINATAWAQTFPKQVQSAEQSLRFVQKLLAVGVSNVVYLRNTFPKEAFANGKALGNIPIRMLKSNNPIKEAGSLAAYIISAMEALAQKFLRELHLIIHQDGNVDSVLEVYTFRFTYPEDGSVLLEMGVEREGGNKATQANIKKDTVSLLQTLLDYTQGLPPLPDNCFMTVDITYFDELVPVDYQPEGFQESAIFQVPSGANKVGCGSVSTNYHALAVQVVKVNPAEEGSNVQRNALDKQGDVDEQGGQTPNAAELAENCSATCVCGSSVRDPLMLKCSNCGLEEHGACYKIVDKAEAPAQHYCLSCSVAPTAGLVCTDPKLVILATKKPEIVGNVCTYRRMLAILVTEEFDNLYELVSRLGVEHDYSEQLFRKLCEDGIVSSGDGTNFMIYQENLQKAMGKRFGGKWKEGQQKNGGEVKEGEEGTNTAGVENQGSQQDHVRLSRPGVSGDNIATQEVQQEVCMNFGSGKQGQSMLMQEKTAMSGIAGSRRGKQPKSSTSGILDVSFGVEHNGAEEMTGTRKRKGQASASRGGAGGDLGKRKRGGKGK